MVQIHVRTRDVGDRWTWFSDYLFAAAKWRVTCPGDRQCQVGMGIFAFGKPWGEIIRFSGSKEFWTIGLGSVHVRVTDGGGTCSVRLDLLEQVLIPVVTSVNLAAVNAAPSQQEVAEQLERANEALKDFRRACEEIERINKQSDEIASRFNLKTSDA